MSEKNQEPIYKDHVHVKEDLVYIQEYSQTIINITHALRHCQADLLDENLDYACKDGKRFLEIRFNFLDGPEAQRHIQSYGPFFRLYYFLKDRYHATVLNSNPALNTQHS